MLRHDYPRRYFYERVRCLPPLLMNKVGYEKSNMIRSYSVQKQGDESRGLNGY